MRWAQSIFLRVPALKIDLNNKDALQNFVIKAQNPKPLGVGYEKALNGLDKYLKELKGQKKDRKDKDDKKKAEEKRRADEKRR